MRNGKQDAHATPLRRGSRAILAMGMSMGMVVPCSAWPWEKAAGPDPLTGRYGAPYDTLLATATTSTGEDLIRLTLVQHRPEKENTIGPYPPLKFMVVTLLSDGSGKRVVAQARGREYWITRDGKRMVYGGDGLYADGRPDSLQGPTVWVEEIATGARKRLVSHRDPSPDFEWTENHRLRIKQGEPSGHLGLGPHYYHAPSDRVFINDPPWLWICDLASGKRRSVVSAARAILPLDRDQAVVVEYNYDPRTGTDAFAKLLDLHSGRERMLHRHGARSRGLWVDGMSISDDGAKIALYSSQARTPDTLFILDRGYARRAAIPFEEWNGDGRIDPTGKWLYFWNRRYIGRVRLDEMIRAGKVLPAGWLERHCEVVFGSFGTVRAPWFVRDMQLGPVGAGP